jgi:ABC-type branched-subunit amino acid transport system ATPase component
VLVIDHDLRMITSLCKRIVVLDVGRVIAAGTPHEVTADPAVITAYIGTSAAREPAGPGRQTNLLLGKE